MGVTPYYFLSLSKSRSTLVALSVEGVPGCSGEAGWGLALVEQTVFSRHNSMTPLAVNAR